MDRYEPYAGNDGMGYCDPHPEGDYVRYADVENLLRQVALSILTMQRIAEQIDLHPIQNIQAGTLRLASASLRLNAGYLSEAAKVKPHP